MEVQAGAAEKYLALKQATDIIYYSSLSVSAEGRQSARFSV